MKAPAAFVVKALRPETLVTSDWGLTQQKLAMGAPLASRRKPEIEPPSVRAKLNPAS